MRRRRFNTSLKVAFKELYTLFIVKKAMLVKLVHIFTHLNQDVDLTWFRKEGEFCLCYFDNTGLNLLVIFIIKSSNCKANTHEFELAILVDCLSLKKALDFPHIASRCQLIPKSNLYSICNVRTDIGCYILFNISLLFWTNNSLALIWTSYLNGWIGLWWEISNFTSLIIL